jgi:hypothetical protein
MDEVERIDELDTTREFCNSQCKESGGIEFDSSEDTGMRIPKDSKQEDSKQEDSKQADSKQADSNNPQMDNTRTL